MILRPGLIFFLSALEGIFVFVQLLFIPSETANMNAFGLSGTRMLLLSLIAAGISGFLTGGILSSAPGTKKTRRKVSRLFSNDSVLFFILLILYSVFFFSIQVLFLIHSPVREWDSSIRALSLRASGMLVWGVLCSVQFLIFLQRKAGFLTRCRSIFTVPKMVLLFGLPNLVYALLCWKAGNSGWFYRIEHFEWFFFLPFQLTAIAWLGRPLVNKTRNAEKITAGFTFIMVTLVTFVIYRFTGQLMGRWNTPAKAYWNHLAEAFWQGDLFLTNPDTTHDLTFYNGHWFVPNPPLPAIIMMPLIKFSSAYTFNTALFSAWVGAINSGIIFLILRKASQRGLLQTASKANLWLTAVFAIGTNHWWLSILGQMWFVSQILAVTFSALAVLSALNNRQPFITGTLLGLAVLSRPNLFALFPFLLGIALFEAFTFPEIRWRTAFRWVMAAGIPVLAAGLSLLGYNYLRFENWFDFGYVTINGADWIRDAVTKYGMFNLHFLKTNLDVMLFRVPQISIQGNKLMFDPGIAGYSLFVMTPPVFYCFRRFKINWWTLGALISIFISLCMLLTYHNTGAEQIGYRYAMDFILPLILLMGQGMGKKAAWLFRCLTGIAVLINAISIHWWFLGR